MMKQDYSQVPVMTSEREVKGFLVGNHSELVSPSTPVPSCPRLYGCAQEIGAESSLFDAVRIIAEHDCVLIRDAKKVICGIVTASDISMQFQQLAEPFLMLGDIEIAFVF